MLPSWQAPLAQDWPPRCCRPRRCTCGEILAQYQGGKCDHLAYRLARRNAHNADAALSNLYSAMLRSLLYVRGNAEVVGISCACRTPSSTTCRRWAPSAVVQPLSPWTRPRELAQSLLASLQQLALELERAQHPAGCARPTAPRRWPRCCASGAMVPAAPSAHSLMAAQLQLVGKVFQLQAQARQLVTTE